MTIYADEVFAINAVSNFLLFYAYCMLYRIRIRKIRLVTASFLGGLYAVFDAVLALPGLIRVAILFCMVCISLGLRGTVRHTLRVMFLCVCVEAVTVMLITFFGGSAIIGGMVLVFASGPVAAVIYVLTYPTVIIIERIVRAKRRYRRVTILYDGKETEFNALYDSGNLLRYKGKSVIMIGWEIAERLFGYTSYNELENNSTAFVMYGTLSGSGAMPVFEDVRCYINGLSVNAVIAVSKREFSCKYKGIIGGE